MRIAAWILLAVCGAAAAEEPELPGVPVSRPLTPVTLLEVPATLPSVAEEKPEPPPVKEAEEPSRTVRPQSWASLDLLLWWTKAQPLPNLVTASTGSAQAALGGPETRVLVGGSSLGNGMQTGFRFNLGWMLSDEIGFEFGGLFLGTRVASATFGDNGNYTSIGRPYTDANTGMPSALIVAGGGMGTGFVTVDTTTRTQGWEINGTTNLVDAGEVTVTALAGYRYFAANESLQIQQMSLRAAPGAPPSVLWGVYDQFDARNNFQGGQIGLRIDAAHDRWLFAFSGKVALGSNFETVQIGGGSTAATAALPSPAVTYYNSGFLAANSNSGRIMEPHFAVLPEAKLNIGYRIFDHTHLFAGYDFLYLSDAVRPGDQVDTTIDPSRSPIANNGNALGANRPRQPFLRSDFWVQGLVLGLDCRY